MLNPGIPRPLTKIAGKPHSKKTRPARIEEATKGNIPGGERHDPEGRLRRPRTYRARNTPRLRLVPPHLRRCRNRPDRRLPGLRIATTPGLGLPD